MFGNEAKSTHMSIATNNLAILNSSLAVAKSCSYEIASNYVTSVKFSTSFLTSASTKISG